MSLFTKTEYEKRLDTHEDFIRYLYGLDDGFYLLSFKHDSINRLVYLRECNGRDFSAHPLNKKFYFIDFENHFYPPREVHISEITDEIDIIPVSIVKSKNPMDIKDLQSI